MYTKSIIQQKIESLNKINNFFEDIQYITDKYIVENSVFAFRDQHTVELVKGYFRICEEYNSLDALRENYDNSKHSCIRIVNNEKFQCGQYIETTNESHKDDLIYNISTQKLISQ